mgnify:CR=1 FL=1
MNLAVDLQEIVKKHAKHFVDTSGGRKALEGISYREDGSIMITDSTILLHLKNVHSLAEPVVKHYRTGRVIDEKYPNLNSILNKQYPNDLKVDVRETVKYLDVLKASSVFSDFGELKDDLTFKVEDVMRQSFTLNLKGEINGEFNPVCMKVSNLYKCFSVFRDLDEDNVNIRVAGSKIPLSFTDLNDRVEIIISPVWRR